MDARGQHADGDMALDAALRQLLVDVLGLTPARVAAFTPATALFGALPEFDSMAVATLLTEMEDRMGFIIDDDAIDADTLATFGALTRFVHAHRPSPSGA